MVRSRLGRWLGVFVIVGTALLGGAATATADEGVPAQPAIHPLTLCAADYSVYIHVNQTTNGWLWSRTFDSAPIRDWQCATFYHDTLDQWAQVDVTVIRSDGSHQYIDSRWYNSYSQGLTILANGDQWNPWIESWYS